LRDRADDIVGVPLGECHDAAEGHVPTHGHRSLGEGLGPCIAMQDTAHAEPSGILDQGARVGFGFAGVDNDRPIERRRERQLVRKRCALSLTRRVVVVVVQSTFTDRDCPCLDRRLDPLAVPGGVVRGRIVGVDAGGARDE
jgi:hypothetical protein